MVLWWDDGDSDDVGTIVMMMMVMMLWWNNDARNSLENEREHPEISRHAFSDFQRDLKRKKRNITKFVEILQVSLQLKRNVYNEKGKARNVDILQVSV